MELAVVLNVHNQPELARDTLDALALWATPNIITMVDKKGWNLFKDFKHNKTEVVCGVFHGAKKSPYKNIILGLLKAYEKYPTASWYICTEFDCLFISDGFKEDLQSFENRDVSMLGINIEKKTSNNHWIVKKILGEKVKQYKALGALMIFSNKCVKTLFDLGFYSQILEITKDYKADHFPNFTDYAVEEIMLPSAASFVGEIKPLVINRKIQGKYAVDFGKDIVKEQIKPITSIVHPSKKFDSPIRSYYRNLREQFKC